jgi:hypothetical protein
MSVSISGDWAIVGVPSDNGLFHDSGSAHIFQLYNLDIVCDPTADWKNHGMYMRCVSHEVEMLVSEGAITQEEGNEIISSAAQSDIGKKGDIN